MLAIKYLTFGFGPEKQIIKDLLSPEEKKIYALMGGNGAGKTTLFNLIIGFYQATKLRDIVRRRKSDTPAAIHHQQPRHWQSLSGLAAHYKTDGKMTILSLAIRHNPTDNWHHAMLPEQFYSTVSNPLD
jgi:ABC-type branched-subunit amino acid transport system ATPase component